MNFLDAILQGVVQGLTEFLPVSSSGHLLITQHILGVTENNLFFSVMLHIGTLLAVLAVYRKTIWSLIVSFFSIIGAILTGKFNFKKLDTYQNMVIMLIIGLLPLFLLFLPVPGCGKNIKDIAEELASDSNIILVGISLIITSILLYLGIKSRKNAKFKCSYITTNNETKIWDGRKKLTIMDSIYIGVTQLIAAIFPGISRSGSTLSTALLRNINKETGLEYSFILGIPAIIAAALLETKEAIEDASILSIDVPILVVGMITSAIVGFIAIKLFQWLLKTDKMILFVIYTFIVGLLVIVIGAIEQYIGTNVFTGFSI